MNNGDNQDKKNRNVKGKNNNKKNVSKSNEKEKWFKKLGRHKGQIIILYIFVIISIVFSLIKFGEKNDFSTWFETIRDIALAIASSTLAVSCAIPYLKINNNIKKILDIKVIVVVVMSIIYFLLYFEFVNITVYNFVLICLAIIFILILSIITLYNYFLVQEECDKLIDESVENKLRETYAGDFDSLPGDVGKVTEKAVTEISEIKISDIDFGKIMKKSSIKGPKKYLKEESKNEN